MKLLATDLDGTLLNTHHTVSDENITALKEIQRKGLTLAIVTGRTYADALSICQKSGLDAHIISNNGAYAYLSDGTLLSSSLLPPENVRPALAWLDEQGYYYEIASSRSLFIPSWTRKLLEEDFARAQAETPGLDQALPEKMNSLIHSQAGLVEFDSYEELCGEDVRYSNLLGLTFSAGRREVGKDFFTRLPGVSMVTSNPFNFEAVSATASKGAALSCLAAHLGVSLEDVIAIGDNHNDLSMLRLAGVSVAMGNAEEAIRSVCRHVSLTNDEHGVAHILTQLGLL